jgi:PAS domain S-box-containing protein
MRPMPPAAPAEALPDEDARPLRSSFGRGSARGAGAGILLVEAHPPDAARIQASLEALGHRLLGVADTRDAALALLRRGRPELVLINVRLQEEGDGVRAAKAMVAELDVPVVFLASDGDEATFARAAEVPASGYLVQPVYAPQLSVVLRIALERHAAASQLRQLNAAFDSASIGMILVDTGEPSHRVVFANRAASTITGRGADEIRSLPALFMAADPAHPDVRKLADALECALEMERVVRGLSPEGAARWLAVSVFPVRELANDNRFALLFLRDVTGQRQAEMALAAHQRFDVVGRMAAGVAFDFNNVLAGILASVNLLRMSSEVAESQGHVEAVARCVRRGVQLSTSLHAFSRQSGGAEDQCLDLMRVVAETRPILESIFGDRVQLAFHPSADDAFVRMELISLEQVLINLAGALREALRDGGQVTFRVHTPRLDGAGAPPATLVRLAVVAVGPTLDLAGQVQRLNTLLREKISVDDANYGLAVCRLLVEHVGGRLSVEEASPPGLRFCVDLPRSDPFLDVHADGEVSLNSLDDTVQGTCLLVERDPVQLRAYARALQIAGLEVVSVQSYEAARMALPRLGEELRLFVCDIGWADVRCVELIKAVRSQVPGVGELFISGGGSFNDLPGTDVLWKPFRLGTLARMAREKAAEVAVGLRMDESAYAPLPVEDPGGDLDLLELTMNDEHYDRVLIVDDDPVFRKAAARFLEGRPVRVFEAGSMTEALELVRAEVPLLALVDVNLPDMDGIHLITALHQIDPTLQTLVISADASSRTLLRAFQARSSSYLTKPLERLTFVLEVDHLLQAGKVARMQRQLLMTKAGLTDSFRDLATTTRDFEAALTGLFMVYQPIVRPYSHSIYAYEALLRTQSAALPGPLQLVAAADALGRVDELGRAVRAHIARTLREHPDCYQPIFVNLHPNELKLDLLAPDEPLQPHATRVVLEVTERAQLAGDESIRLVVPALRNAGFRVALDDLGEGYAGLSWLVKLTPDVAKLDISLVRDIDTSQLKRQLVASLISVCRRAGILVLAEGVEHSSEALVLGELGCDLLQGYYFARPGLPFPSVKPGRGASGGPTDPGLTGLGDKPPAAG